MGGRLPWLLVGLVLSGCVSHRGEVSGTGPCGHSMQMTFEIPAPETETVDILFVVDNSMSMMEEQAQLTRDFSALLEPLLETSVLDLHLGVASTDCGTGGFSVETCSDPIDGDGGELQHTPNSSIDGCDPSYPTYLDSGTYAPGPGMVDDLALDFRCIATLGINGCGFEQQLKAAEWALVRQADATNAGFVRPGSILVVVWMTDENDCSIAPGHEDIFDTLDSSLGHLGLRCFHHPYKLETIEHYVEVLSGLRPDPVDLIVGVIAGVPQDPACVGRGTDILSCLDHEDMQEVVDPISMTRLVPSCVTSTGEAYTPRRIVELALAFPGSAIVGSVCSESYAPFLADLGAMIDERSGNVETPVPLPVVRVEGETDLCQVSCTIVEVLPDGRPCSELGLACHDPEGTGCVVETDGAGEAHSLCDVPQVATRLDDPADDCADPRAARSPADGAGWAYDPASSKVRLVGALRSAPGSMARLSCCF